MNLPQQYVRLATIAGNKIELHQEGLNVLEEFDFCSVVTVEGGLQSVPLNLGEFGLAYNPDNCILVQKHPFYSTRLKRYVIVLRVPSNDVRVINVAHTFCSLLSHVVVLGGYENMDLHFLTLPPNIIMEKQAFPARMASLVGLTEDGQSPDIVQNNERFKQALEKQGIQAQSLITIYPDCSSYQLPLQRHPNPSSVLLPIIESLLQSKSSHSTILIHGQVIQEYAIGLADQYNGTGKMYPSKAEDEIEVDQYFDDYLAAVERYNAKCKNGLGNESQNDITGNLKQIRYETEQEKVFQSSPHYGKKIGRYMDRKELELTSLNQQFNDTYNLNLLQKESTKCLQAVSGNRNLSQQDVSKEIDRVVARYNEKSRGNNRHKLLTEFMQVFVPTVYAEAGVSDQVDKKINSLAKENKNLEEELVKLQKKQSSKCCTIM